MTEQYAHGSVVGSSMEISVVQSIVLDCMPRFLAKLFLRIGMRILLLELKCIYG